MRDKNELHSITSSWLYCWRLASVTRTLKAHRHGRYNFSSHSSARLLAGNHRRRTTIPPLASEIRLAFEGEPWTLAELCGRAVAVTGPITVAVVLMALLELAIRSWKQERQLKAAHPTEPWLWKPQWAAKHMRLSNKPLIIGWLCFFAIYLLVPCPWRLPATRDHSWCSRVWLDWWHC